MVVTHRQPTKDPRTEEEREEEASLAPAGGEESGENGR